MLYKLVHSWLLKLDDRYITIHLQRVEQQLRHCPIDHLTLSQKIIRYQLLDHLRTYRQQGVFPRNCVYPGGKIPCFMDESGRYCAVGALMIASEAAPLAEHIAVSANYARIKAIVCPALDQWSQDVGFTTEELAAIQPEYGYAYAPELLPLMQLLVATGIVVLLANIRALWRHQLYKFLAPTTNRFLAPTTIGYGFWLLYFALTEGATQSGLVSYGNPFGDIDLAISLVAIAVGIGTLIYSIRRHE